MADSDPACQALSFWVPGTPRGGGSKRGFVNPKTGGVIITDAGGEPTKIWRSQIIDAAREAYHGPLLTGPLELTVEYWFIRPKAHHRTGKFSHITRDSAPKYHTQKPDTTKLLRATEDALNKILWRDDSQIVSQYATKAWSIERAGALVKVASLL